MNPPRILLLVALGLAACAEKIPGEYQDLVPEAERSALSKVLPLDNPAPGDLPSLMLWYDAKKTSPGKVGAAFLKQFEKAGYELLLDCEQEENSVDYIAAKPGENREIVQFSASLLGDTTVDGRLVRSTKIDSVTRNDKRKCKWTELAKKRCKGDLNQVCLLDDE